MSFLIAKQPIFNKEGRIVAYEVYLRKKDNMLEYPKEVPYNRSAYIILQILTEHGIDRVGEGKKVMLNVSVDALLNRAFENLPPEKLIFELLKPQIQVGEVIIGQALKSMSRFKEAGALFASYYELLEDERYQKFIEGSSLISVDFSHLNDKRIEQLKAKGKKVIVTKIETKEQYEKALKVGDFFEGNYLESPYILKEFEIAPYLKTTLLRLMSVVHNAQSTKEIAEFISYDVGLTAKLLRFVNSAYFSPIQEIKSVEQACSMLGLKNLKNFIFLLAMNDYISVEKALCFKKPRTHLVCLANPLQAQKAHMVLEKRISFFFGKYWSKVIATFLTSNLPTGKTFIALSLTSTNPSLSMSLSCWSSSSKCSSKFIPKALSIRSKSHLKLHINSMITSLLRRSSCPSKNPLMVAKSPLSKAK